MSLRPQRPPEHNLLEDQQQRWRQRLRKFAGEPFSGEDRDGRLPLSEFADAEARAARSASPRGRQWPEVERFDARVAQLQERQRDITTALAAMHDKRSSAPGLALDALAAWELADRQGPRPASDVDDIDRDIEQLQADYDALTRAADQVLKDKSDYVERHRGRLVKTADSAAQDATDRLVALIDEVESARSNLIDLRKASVWSALYPDPLAGQVPALQQVHGGLRQPVEQALGVPVAVQAERVFELLRQDARWLKDAATSEQKAALQGRDRNPVSAVWNDSDEGREAERAEREGALKRYVDMWGREPA